MTKYREILRLHSLGILETKKAMGSFNLKESTLIYAYADTKMKREAIEKADKKSETKLPQKTIWKDDDEMIRKLCGLK